jgi:hypothetical protein
MKVKEPKIEIVKVSSLKPNPGNPRTISKEKMDKLEKSIQDFPEMLRLRPIIVTDKGITLGGNMRLQALKNLKIVNVPIIRASNLTKAQQKEFIIKDNVSFGEWDWDALGEWDMKELTKWGIDIPAFVTNGQAAEDNYTVPDEIKTSIKLGDLFLIGKHRLLCGDSTKAKDVAKLMNGELCDLVVTDPPYNVNYEGGTGLTIQNDHMDDNSFYKFLLAFFVAFAENTKQGGGLVCLARGQRGRKFPKCDERFRFAGKTMPDMGKKFLSHGQAGLPMAPRTMPIRMEGGRRPLLHRGPSPHDRDR